MPIFSGFGSLWDWNQDLLNCGPSIFQLNQHRFCKLNSIHQQSASRRSTRSKDLDTLVYSNWTNCYSCQVGWFSNSHFPYPLPLPRVEMMAKKKVSLLWIPTITFCISKLCVSASQNKMGVILQSKFLKKRSEKNNLFRVWKCCIEPERQKLVVVEFYAVFQLRSHDPGLPNPFHAQCDCIESNKICPSEIYFTVACLNVCMRVEGCIAQR